MSTTTLARKLVLAEKASNAESIAPAIVPLDLIQPPEGHAVVHVQAAAVNPSDVKAALGMMPHAIWPRTPGRDFAGVVVAGPDEWLGAEVWGTGGDLGMTRDGTHSTYLVLPVSALTRKPSTMGIAAAATIGVPFITAYEGLRRAGLNGQGQAVLVLGVNGKVGQAATQLATRAGARVIGVERGASGYIGHATSNVQVFHSEDPELAQKIMAATGGRGADIAYNTVGSPYFGLALETLAVGGTQILISTIERNVPFDILAFYRRNLQMLGVDSLKLTAVQCAAILNELLPGFKDGSLKAFDVDASTLLPLEQASDAYRKVLAGSTERVVLAP
ncbi:zinc-binding alcohol dehydrogenase family protein [Ralstonia insidiosa]|uniref:Oxidoreductase n=1 Tax=Ralstonia insidiosa TaxID=190721 RepID=A0A191ZVI3_9RALS|nr:zinc-binding alcohol dehydrogenase family protein [Ralstonia insidiosa]ANJ72093.1 oxidoreductase [Ralstonia insidiosa]KAB0472716.1 zinc-binding alcohol dehydrogenase family protein [Ralstonia insidiosa]MBY4907671.1 zinc-binding alcohol dehydrogenase family protein [Ralstonia insidiosa]